jgi:hypothetical protein
MVDLHMPNMNAADARVASFVFEFVQFLLDDDINLTPAGNLTGAARQKLRERLQELITAEEAGGSRDAVPGETELPDLTELSADTLTAPGGPESAETP